MAINPIQNGELGSSVRSKLNQAIQEANKVSGKQDSSGLGSAAFESVDAFDPVGSAQEAEDFAVQRENHTGEQPIETVSDLRDELDKRVVYVDTVAELQALDTGGLVEGQQASVGEAGIFVWSGSEWLPKNNETITVRIPSDYPTLQEAIDTLSNFKPAQGVIIDLLIESGHEPESGVSVSNGDYGHFRISSEDPEVKTSGDFSLSGEYARLPILNCLVDLSGSSGFYSYWANNVSTGLITSGAGMKNGTRGLYASNSSSIMADGVIFTGFDQAGCHASRNSNIQCTDADFSDNSQDGLSNYFGAIYASRSSRIHGQFINARNSQGICVRAQRLGEISCPEIDVSESKWTVFLATLSGRIYSTSGSFTAENIEGPGIVCDISYVHVNGTLNNSSGSDETAIECRQGFVSFAGDVKGFTGNVIVCRESGVVSARSITISSGSNGMLVEQGGRVNARSCEITGMTSNGVFAERGGYIEVADGTITGSGSNDIAVQRGGWIVASGCSTTNGVGEPDPADTNVSSFNFSDNGNQGFIWA